MKNQTELITRIAALEAERDSLPDDGPEQDAWVLGDKGRELELLIVHLFNSMEVPA